MRSLACNFLGAGKGIRVPTALSDLSVKKVGATLQFNLLCGWQNNDPNEFKLPKTKKNKIFLIYLII